MADQPMQHAESVAGIRIIFGKEMRGGLEAGHQHMSWSSTPVPRCPACVEWAKEVAHIDGLRGGNVSADDVRPMTPDEVAWVRAQRVTEVDDEACRVPGVAEGTCAYAGPDGADGCGARCLYRPALNDGQEAPDGTR